MVKNAPNRSQPTPSPKKIYDIFDTNVNDSEWSCVASFLVPTSLTHKRYHDTLLTAIGEGRRKSLRCITRTDVLKNVCQHSLSASIPSIMESWPLAAQFSQACAEAAVKLSDSKQLPATEMSRLIKFLILKLRHEELQKRRLIEEQKMKQQMLLDRILRPPEIALIIPGEKSRSKSRDSNSKESKTSSISEKHKSNSIKIPKNVKDKTETGRTTAITELKRRGEENWSDLLDDAPLDGPDTYIVFGGFTDATLPLELLRVGVPLNSIIAFPKPDIGKQQAEDNRTGVKIVPIQVINEEADEFWPHISEIGDSQYTESVFQSLSKQTHMLHEFWRSFRKIYTDPAIVDVFQECPFIYFEPKYQDMDLEDTEHIKDIQKYICDETANLMYDIYEVYLQNRHYLNNMKLQDLTSDLEYDDTEVYNFLLNLVPGEGVTIALVLHCICEQVSFNHEAKNSLNYFVRKNQVPSNASNAELSSKLSDALLMTVMNMHKSHGLQTDINTNAETLLILFGDKVMQKTYHLSVPWMDLQNINDSVLKLAPLAQLWNRFKDQTLEEAEFYQMHLEKLAQFLPFENMSIYSIQAMLHILIFRYLQQRATTENPRTCYNSYSRTHKICKEYDSPVLREVVSEAVLSQTEHVTCRFHSEGHLDCLMGKIGRKSEFHCQELLDLVTLTDTLIYQANGRKIFQSVHSFYDGYSLIEEISSTALLQAIAAAQNFFTTYQYKYFAPTDSIILVFYNPCDHSGVDKRRNFGLLVTPVLFRDFYMYVQDDEVEWLTKERKRDQQLHLTDSMLTVLSQNTHGEPLTVDNSTSYTELVSEKLEFKLFPGCGNTDFLVTDTIKYNNYITSMNVKKENDIEITGRLINTGKSKRKSNLKRRKKDTTDTDTKQNNQKKKHKSKSRKNLPATKDLVQNSQSGNGKQEKSTELSLPFLGYNLGRVRVEISESVTSFHGDMNCIFTYRVTKWLHMCKSITMLHAIRQHKLVFHLPLWPLSDTLQDILFHLVLQNGVVIAFSLQKPLDAPTESVSSDSVILPPDAEDEERPPLSEAHRRPMTVTFQKRSLDCRLSLSIPTGLHLTFVRTSDNRSYVKQTNMSKGPECSNIMQETYRCCLYTGNILRFMRDGTVEILCPDGTMYYCENVSEMEYRMDSYSQSRMSTEDKEFSPDNFANSDVFQISSYKVITPDGKLFQVTPFARREVCSRLTSRFYTDFFTGRHTMRRSDGLQLIQHGNGNMTVIFPDESVITSTVVVDENDILEDDSVSDYVSLNLHFTLEHKNYVTVLFTGGRDPSELKLPHNCDVVFNGKNIYEVRTPDFVMSVTPPKINVFHDSGCNHFVDLTAYCNQLFETNSDCNVPSFLTKITDAIGREYLLDYFGHSETREGGLPTDKESTENRLLSPYKRRCFVISRDLTGRELIHRQLFEEYIAKVKRDDFEVGVATEYNSDPALKIHVTIVPYVKNKSQSWLMPISSMLLEENKSQTLPSTYGDPSSWFHPFPLKKNLEEKWDIDDVVQFTENAAPLILRLFREVVPSDMNVVTTVKAAIMEYKMNVNLPGKRLTSFLMSHEDFAVRPKSVSFREQKFRVSSSPAAVALYRHGIAVKKSSRKKKVQLENETIVKRTMDKLLMMTHVSLREKEKVKNLLALRYHIITPYFKSAEGLSHYAGSKTRTNEPPRISFGSLTTLDIPDRALSARERGSTRKHEYQSNSNIKLV